MTQHVNVIGVGLTQFKTPIQNDTYVEMGHRAIREALADATLPYQSIEQAYASYVYGDIRVRR